MSNSNTKRRKQKKLSIPRKPSPYNSWDEFFKDLVPSTLNHLKEKAFAAPSL